MPAFNGVLAVSAINRCRCRKHRNDAVVGRVKARQSKCVGSVYLIENLMAVLTLFVNAVSGASQVSDKPPVVFVTEVLWVRNLQCLSAV